MSQEDQFSRWTQAAIAEAAEYLDGRTVDGWTGLEAARWCADHSQGPDTEINRWHMELPARYSRSGNPLPFTVRFGDD